MKLLILTSLLCINTIFTHDVQVATFTIYQDAGQLQFEIVLEQEDLEHTFAERQIDLKESAIKTYLKDKVEISINKKSSLLSYDKVESRSHHIYVSGNISQPKKKIKTIQIKNTCLLNIEEHSNIIQIRLNDQERDFLMNKDRQELEIKL